MSTGRRHWNFYWYRKWVATNLYFSTINPSIGFNIRFERWSVTLCINLLLVGGFVTVGKWGYRK